MNLKKLIKSRRGVAIELAIGVMFLLMAFTIMLLSTAGLQNRHRNDDYNSFKERIEINNVGEYVVENRISYSGASQQVIANFDDYSVSNTDNIYTIYKGDEVVLTIEMDDNGTPTDKEDDTITSWK